MRRNKTKYILAVFAAAFFFTTSVGVTNYSNSTFIGSLGFSASAVSFIYIFGSLLTIAALLTLPRIIEQQGNIRVAFGVMGIVLVALLVLGLAQTTWLLLVFFLASIALNVLVLFEMDVFLEHFSEAKRTGRIRGIFMTIINAAWTISPILAGYSIDRYGLQSVYSIGFVGVLIALTIAVFSFRKVHFRKTHRQSLGDMYHNITHTRDFSSVFVVSVLMNFFYAIMIIYTPIHLNIHIGFSWGAIGLLFTLMHIPFIVLEYPIGRLADTRFGEKEMMMIGLCIAGLSSLAFVFLDTASFTLWAIVLIISRVGMSLIETTSESYFFKKIKHDDIAMISAQRIAAPLAYSLAPLVGLIIGVIFSSPTVIFTLLGLMMISGIYFAHRLNDTR